MFLRALYDHAKENLELAPAGFGEVGVRYLIEIGPDGPRLVDTSDERGRPIRLMLPRLEVQRSSGVKPCLLADNGEYVLGAARDYSGSRKSADAVREAVGRRHSAFVSLVEDCYEQTGDEATGLVVSFLNQLRSVVGLVSSGRTVDGLSEVFGPGGLPEDLDLSARYSFTVGGEPVSDSAAVRSFWSRASEPDSGIEGQCMITGEYGPVVEKMIGSVRGLPGGLQTGSKLISFNNKSFESYGNVGMSNAPLSPDAARAIDAGLSDLMGRFENRITVGDTVYLFWGSGVGEGAGPDSVPDGGMDFSSVGALLAALVAYPMGARASELLRLTTGVSDLNGEAGPEGEDSDDGDGAGELSEREVYALASRLMRGSGIRGAGALNSLALRAQAGRVSVRSFVRSTGGEMISAAGRFILAQRLPDLRGGSVESDLPPRGAGALVGAALGASESSSHPRLTDSLVRSLLSRQSVGDEIQTYLVRSMRVGGPSGVAAQFAKLLLVMKGVLEVDDLAAAGATDEQTEELTEGPTEELTEGETYKDPSFDDERDGHAFDLGRLLAMLENIQRVSLGRPAGSSVAGRHYGLCVSSPSIGFSAPLNRANRAHLPSIRRKRGGLFFTLNEQLDQVLARLPEPFPKSLSLQRQLIFGLGYRHEQALGRARARAARAARTGGRAAGGASEG